MTVFDHFSHLLSRILCLLFNFLSSLPDNAFQVSRYSSYQFICLGRLAPDRADRVCTSPPTLYERLSASEHRMLAGLWLPALGTPSPPRPYRSRTGETAAAQIINMVSKASAMPCRVLFGTANCLHSEDFI